MLQTLTIGSAPKRLLLWKSPIGPIVQITMIIQITLIIELITYR